MSLRTIPGPRIVQDDVTQPRAARRWLWLTLPIAVLLALVSVVGWQVPGFYTGPPVWTVQAVAQDIADLFFVLPILVVSAWLAARGSARAWLVWLGMLSYVIYTFVIYAFAVHYNRLFLAYVAVLGLSLWAFIGGMATTRWAELRSRFAADAPSKVVSLFLLVPGLLFTLLWLSVEIPALQSGVVPKEVTEAGLFTNPVHVLDLSMMLPAMLVAGVLLWRGSTLGYGLAPVLLVNVLCQDVAIATMMVLAARSGLPAGPVPLFVGLGVITLAALGWHLRAFREARGPAPAQTGAAPSPLD